MAAGEGKRMNSNIPKVLHKFCEKPMLIRIIEESYKLNPNKIIIITGKYDELIRNTINECIDKSILNKIIYVNQINPLGTGDAIKSALNLYDNNENILILNGDMPLISFELLNDFSKKNIENKNMLANLMVAELENPFGYGRIIYDTNNEFIKINEEKDCSNEEKKIKTVNVGIYLFSSEVLHKFIPLITNDNSQKEYYLTDIIKIIKFNTNISIKTFLIENEKKYQIMGINTQEELKNLESIYYNIINNI